MTTTFKANLQTALANGNLAGALGRFAEAYRGSRARAYEGIDFEALRDRIAERKGHAAGHYPELAARFQAAAAARGAKVFRTADPAEVKRYILDLARAEGVRRVVKSKSMASEEIHLNKALTGAAIEVDETDLGEWIIQLAHQTPSHMVMPAIHMTKEEVAEVFSQEVEPGQAPDIPRLVKFARERLRPKFLAADLGITGANIAVAETGSLVIVTNEGNARLVSTLPRIHVAIVGIEKLVEKADDIVPILTALPRSATGQLLTSYVSILSGAVPNLDGSPKQLHIILMDNQRSRMAADPEFKEALQCIRCATCLNVCPVFQLVGGHVFGKTYTGGIGTILTAWFDGLKQSEDIQGLCLQCGACVPLCPGKIDIPRLILGIRRRLTDSEGQSLAMRAIFKLVNNRRLFHAALRTASVAQAPLRKGRFIRHLPLFFAGLTDFRSLPAIAERPFRDAVLAIPQPPSRQKAVFYAGCLIDFAYPEIGEALVKVLNRAGIQVLFPDGQTCCGAPARSNGADPVAARNAEDNVAALLAEEADWVVSACPTCTVALKQDFVELLQDRPDLLPQARALAGKAIDIGTLVQRLVDEGRLAFQDAETLERLTYHDSCHLARTLHASGAPRDLLRRAGHDLKEMRGCDSCCGMAGSYALKHPELSAPILARKLAAVRETGADRVAMDCPGCVMQIRGGLDAAGDPIQAEHTVEILARRLKER